MPTQEDRHSLVPCLRPLGSNGQPLPGGMGADDGVQRSWAAVFDGHNGSGAAVMAAGVHSAEVYL